MAVKNLQTGGVKPGRRLSLVAAEGDGAQIPAKPDDKPEIGQFHCRRHLFADMVSGSGGALQLVDAMDLFEQSRTMTVGGQPGLKAFLDRGLALVVGQIDELVLGQSVPLTPGTDIICEVTLIREAAG